MNKLITTAAALAIIAATGSACARSGSANNSAAANTTTAPSATANSAAPAAAGTAQTAGAEAEVRAFLDGVYAPYAAENGTGPDLGPLLEPQLAEAYAKMDEGIDADPLIDAQDWTPFKPTYEEVMVKGDRAIATVTFSNGGTVTKIAHQLMRTPDGWRIYDVQNASGGSLRERVMNAQP
jgi:hypothetical protein